MKRFGSYFLYTLLLAAIVCACNDDLNIIQNYGYRVETLPLPKSLKQSETVDLEFSIIPEGHYNEAAYKFRYFQSEGEGVLSYRNKAVPMNRFQKIASDDFVLSYTNHAEGQIQLDFVFENNFGRRVEYSIAFSGEQQAEKDR
jgi:hypothetical protein